MAKNEAKIKFTAETGEFNNSIKKANNELSELRAELKLNDSQMQTNGKSVEALEKKHALLGEQLKAQQSKTEALSQKVQKAVEIFGENSDEVSRLRVQLLNAQSAEEKIKKAISNCNQEMEEQAREAEDVAQAEDHAADKAKELDKSLDGLDDAAAKATEGFTVMRGALADLVADGLEAAASGLFDIGKNAFQSAIDVDKATNIFITRTGESEESAEEFKDTMVSIYNDNFGESFEDIADAMSTVKTAMGDIDSGELKEITEQALLMRDTFDFDVNESIRAVNSMMKQFGISSDDAYNLLAQGAQKGLNQNGDLLDVINEYSVQFGMMGYSAEDMFNMLANGVDEGTWSVDKLGDAVKEFNIRAKDGSDSTAEAFQKLGLAADESSARDFMKKFAEGGPAAKKATQDVIKALVGVEDKVEQDAIGVALFGTMWEDLGVDAVSALLTTQGEVSKTSDALDSINEQKYDDLGSALEGVKRNLSTAIIEPLNNEAVPAINDFINGVDWQGWGNTIGGAVSNIVKGFFSFVQITKDAVTWMREHKALMITIATVIGVLATAIAAYNIVAGIKAAMAAAEVTSVWALVSAYLAQAAALLAALAPYVLIVAAVAAVIAIFVALWNNCEGFRNFFIYMWDEIKAVWSEVAPYFEVLWEAVKTHFSIALDFIKAYFLAAWEYIKLVWSVAGDYFKMTWENIKLVFSVVKTWLGGAFKTAWEAIKLVWDVVTGYFKAIWETIKGIFSVVKSVLTGDFQGAWEGIKGIVGTWKEYFSNVWNGIKNVFSAVKSWFSNTFSAAWNAVKGIWSNVSSFFESVVSKVKNTFSNVIDIISKPFKTAIDKVKGFFDNLKLKFPDIKLPHFSITGSFSLNPPSVPHLSIEWYAKAMSSPMILNSPTIFGQANGKLLGGGEAGSEMIGGTNTVMGMIQNAVDKSVRSFNIAELTAAVEALANRPVVLNVNGRQFALATASDADSVNGLRNTLLSRGLVLD